MLSRTAFALVALVTVPLISSPAGAAVPNRPATVTLSCADGTTDKAKFWEYDGTTSGVRNRCDKRWLVILFHADGSTGAVNVAPHAEALWTGSAAMHSMDYDVYVGEPETCASRGSYLQLLGAGGDTPTPEATCGVTPKTHIKYYR